MRIAERCGSLAWIGILALLCLPANVNAGGGTARVSEYELKAIFLYNFAQFVEWPADAFETPASPIIIGVFGQDPFGPTLDRILANETAHGRSLVIRRCQSLDQVEGCHILFISAPESGRLDQIVRTLGGRSVLTVGETRDFTAHDGVISFHLVQRRLRLRVNRAAATAAHLTISSQLLRQAEVVANSKAPK